MSLKKNPMPSQDPEVRSRNFDEVALGYTVEQAIDEANRCLNCKHKPCVAGCPVAIDIPAFIAKIKEADFEGAYQVLSRSSALPAVCGRVCPQESQCEAKCVRGIKGEPVAIGRLERFVADYHMAHSSAKASRPEPNGHQVAVIGAGPAGLTLSLIHICIQAKFALMDEFRLRGGGYWNVMRPFAQNWAFLSARYEIEKVVK